MLLVLPYCANDAALAESLLEYLPDFGPYSNHQALLVRTPDAPDLNEQAQGVFPGAKTIIVDNAASGWPAGPNSMFAAAARHIAGADYPGAWYFFEPDNTPTVPGWLDRIQAEYWDAHKLFMGAVTPTRVMRNGVEVIDGEHMVGSGVFPKLTADLTLFETLRHSRAPFDVYLQWEILPNCHPTDLIQHVWNTKRCRRRGRGIWAEPGHDLAQPAQLRHRQAVVVHGVKDGSLMKLLRPEAAAA